MSDQQNESSESSDLFGPPPLLRGENEALYAALLAEVDSMIEPKTIMDRIDVRDITDKIWESQRCKRFEARLIESACVSALAHLLAPIFGLDHTRGFEAANRYYGQDALKRKNAAKLLSDHKITDEMILAKALAQVGGHVGDFDRLITTRERSRHNVFKDYQRRREQAAKLAKVEEENRKEPTSNGADRVQAGIDAALEYHQ
jgi:hypothetical protein